MLCDEEREEADVRADIENARALRQTDAVLEVNPILEDLLIKIIRFVSVLVARRPCRWAGGSATGSAMAMRIGREPPRMRQGGLSPFSFSRTRTAHSLTCGCSSSADSISPSSMRKPRSFT